MDSTPRRGVDCFIHSIQEPGAASQATALGIPSSYLTFIVGTSTLENMLQNISTGSWLDLNVFWPGLILICFVFL